MTTWGDNGTEALATVNLIGCQLFAELGYSEDYDRDRFARRFRFCTGGNLEDFEKLEQMYSKARKEVGFIMGGLDSDFYFTRLLERKTDIDLTKYHAPFDIDRYNQELAFKTTVKTALPIAGAVAVGVVIVVLVVVIAVSKKDGTDEPSQAPTNSPSTA